MWDEEDGFYYDLLRLPDGSAHRLKVRSMVGLLPLCATTVIEAWQRERTPLATAAIMARSTRCPSSRIASTPPARGIWAWPIAASWRWSPPSGCAGSSRACSTSSEFLSPYGIRSLSKVHAEHPYILHVGGQEYRVDYLPAESNTGMFGGNSNWRGPIWLPVNALIIRALQQFYLYYGDSFKVECPTGSGTMMNLFEVSKEIADRLTRIFLRDAHGQAAGLRRDARSSRPTRTGATTCSSTSTSTATTARGSAPATRPAGPVWSPRSSSSTVSWTPSASWSWESGRERAVGVQRQG